jgi:hypothetical protein
MRHAAEALKDVTTESYHFVGVLFVIFIVNSVKVYNLFFIGFCKLKMIGLSYH